VSRIANGSMVAPIAPPQGGFHMAETKANRPETSKPGSQTVTSQREQLGSLRRQGQGAWLPSPFDMFDRMSEEMDRTFDRLFRDFMGPRRSWGRSWSRSTPGQGQSQTLWSPRVEAYQQGDRFIIRAELPGLKKEDVQVEVTDGTVTIQGDRR